MAQGDFTRINTNIGALNALNSLKNINTQMGVRQLRLATGKRINEAAEDPAGLTIATKFKYRASGLGVALDNIGDAKNLLAVAEGGLTKINDILVQVRDKTLQAANDALGTDERKAIESQVKSFLSQIDNIVNETKWNSNAMLKGDATNAANDGDAEGGTAISFTFQTGADASETTAFQFASASAGNFYSGDSATVAGYGLGLKVTADTTFASNASSNTYLAAVNDAIKQVSEGLSGIGALSARLTFKEETLSVAKVNTEAAHNRIMNADMAYEQLESTKLGILQQTATAMLSQANQGPQSVLSLFR